MRSTELMNSAEGRRSELKRLEQLYKKADEGELFFPAWLLPHRLVAVKELRLVLGTTGEGYTHAIETLELMLSSHDQDFLLSCYDLFKALFKSLAEVKQEAKELQKALEEAVLYNEPRSYGKALRELVSYSEEVVAPERAEEVYGLLSELEAKALIRGYLA